MHLCLWAKHKARAHTQGRRLSVVLAGGEVVHLGLSQEFSTPVQTKVPREVCCLQSFSGKELLTCVLWPPDTCPPKPCGTHPRSTHETQKTRLPGAPGSSSSLSHRGLCTYMQVPVTGRFFTRAAYSYPWSSPTIAH